MSMPSSEMAEPQSQTSSDPLPVVEEVQVTINSKSLREQVYEYLRGELHGGRLVPGSAINLTLISRQLGISKTPLRDALLQLDVEGFVTISPRRGVFVNPVTLDDVRDSYEIVGSLEGAVIFSVFSQIGEAHIEQMKSNNAKLKAALETDDFQSYYQLNIAFHHVFLDLSDNKMLQRIIMPIRQRLYDFPRRRYIKEWELRNCSDHDDFIHAIEKGDRSVAVSVWRDVHWSFTVYESYIRQFYFSQMNQ
jgi:DNA-binding GntR family transcriptional regulator